MTVTYLPPPPTEPHARELRIVELPGDGDRYLLVTGCDLSRSAFHRLANIRGAMVLFHRATCTPDGTPLSDFTIRFPARAEDDALAALGLGRNYRVDAGGDHDAIPRRAHRRERQEARR